MASTSSSSSNNSSSSSGSTLYWCHNCSKHVDAIPTPEQEYQCPICNECYVEVIDTEDSPESFVVQNAPVSSSTTSSSNNSSNNNSNSGLDSKGGNQPAAQAPGFTSHQFSFMGRPVTYRVFHGSLPGGFASFTSASSGSNGGGFNFMASSSSSSSSSNNSGNVSNQSGNFQQQGGSASGHQQQQQMNNPFQQLLQNLFPGGNMANSMFNNIFHFGHGPQQGFNIGDYGVGNMQHIINQLFFHDPNRYGTPPAAADVVQSLPDLKITQEWIDTHEIKDCSVCKDEFSVGELTKQMPCTHVFHPDCLLPWLKLHNTCPVCRHELPTNDEFYENLRRARSNTASTTENKTNSNPNTTSNTSDNDNNTTNNSTNNSNNNSSSSSNNSSSSSSSSSNSINRPPAS